MLACRRFASSSSVTQPQRLFLQRSSPFLTTKTTTPARSFHVSPLNMVQTGDAVPDVELVEKSPGNKVSLAKELASGKGLIIGVPAAFSMSTLITVKWLSHEQMSRSPGSRACHDNKTNMC